MKIRLKKIRQQEGMTLLETIIAIGVVMAVVISSITISIYTTRIGRSSEDKIVAINLAREGIEAVRNIRDSNWLAGLAWNAGTVIGPGTGCNNWCKINYSIDTTKPAADDIWKWTFSLSGGDRIVCNPGDSTQLKLSTRGIYNYEAGGTSTKFCRVIRIKTDVANEITVTSRVLWKDRAIDKQVILEEKLYDWRQK